MHHLHDKPVLFLMFTFAAITDVHTHSHSAKFTVWPGGAMGRALDSQLQKLLVPFPAVLLSGNNLM